MRRRADVALLKPGAPNAWGLLPLDTPTGEVMSVWKFYCPVCGTLLYRKMEQWYCSTCRIYLEEGNRENI